MCDIIDMMNKKYKVIAVDPPWQTGKTGKRSSRPNQKVVLDYPTMSLDDIKSLPISNLSEDNSIIFLWTIQKYIPTSYSIIEQWGFRYRLTITWDKANGIVLGGFHYRTEFVVVGVKGHWNTFMEKPAMPSVFTAKSPYHSAKPNEFYTMAGNFGEPRLDMFARKKRDDWDCWGDEVESDIDIEDYR